MIYIIYIAWNCSIRIRHTSYIQASFRSKTRFKAAKVSSTGRWEDKGRIHRGLSIERCIFSQVVPIQSLEEEQSSAFLCRNLGKTLTIVNCEEVSHRVAENEKVQQGVEKVQKGLEVAKDASCWSLVSHWCAMIPWCHQDTGKVVMEKTQQGIEVVKDSWDCWFAAFH